MNFNKPLISIITVSYNVVNTIEQTILSIINQNFDNYEYIIIDGGSQDGTLDIIKKYEDKINFWVSEPDKGIYDAMNKGILAANGEWVSFMNAGDRFAIKDINLLEKSFNNKNIDVIYGDMLMEKNQTLSLIKASPLLQLNYSMNFCHQSCFVRTHLLKNMPFSLNYKISADYDFFLKIFIKGSNFYYENCAISVFEYGGISSGISKKYLVERLSIIYDNHTTLKNKLTFTYKFLKMLVPFNRKTLSFFSK